MRIEPKVVRYVSGVATALLGSGGMGDDLKCNSINFWLLFSNNA